MPQQSRALSSIVGKQTVLAIIVVCAVAALPSAFNPFKIITASGELSKSSNLSWREVNPAGGSDKVEGGFVSSNVVSSYVGAAAAVHALEKDVAAPLSLATGDFDEDGMADLVGGYAGPQGGILALYRGNTDSIYPNTPEAKQRRRNSVEGFAPSPFLGPARAFDLAAAPDFAGAGDFDADGHLDMVIAMRGDDQIFWLAGNGHGEFGVARELRVGGRVTAMTTGEINRADGLADVVVAVAGEGGAKVLVFEGPQGALRATPETFALPSEVSDLALGRLDEDYLFDLAIAAGSELTIVEGRDRRLTLDEARRSAAPPAKISRRDLPSTIKSLVIGSFTDERSNQIATLGEDGEVWITTIATAGRGLEWLKAGVGQQASQLIRTHWTGGRFDDLVVMDGGRQQFRVVTADRNADAVSYSVAAINSGSSPISALPMRLHADARGDLVIFREGQNTPLVLSPQVAANFEVNSTGDFGDSNLNDGICFGGGGTVGEGCSLRAAIQQANATGGTNTISFKIPTQIGGVPTITINSGLPAITSPVIIDGASQAVGLVEIAGGPNIGTASGIVITAGFSTVRGLIINRFGASGIELIGNGNNFLEGNRIGTDSAGLEPVRNSFNGVFVSDSANNTIGGTTAAARNLISGNGLPGIFLGPAIPTPGFANLANGKSGGTANSDTYAITHSTSAAGPTTGNVVQGNYIGTDITGTRAISKGGLGGVAIVAGNNNTVGGTTAGARNIVSGNSGSEVFISTSGTINGIPVSGATTGNLVQGNFIAINAAGNRGLGDIEAGGVFIGVNASDNTVGGGTPTARNIISGTGIGVVINGAITGVSNVTGNLVQGNYIGTDAAGTGNVGNFRDGVRVGPGGASPDNAANVSNNIIGGTAPGTGNVIAFNSVRGGSGIVILEGLNSASRIIGNSILGNSIFSNGSLGIDLGDDGVTPNDPGDSDTGANNLQNYPILTSALSSLKSSTISGTLNSLAVSTFRLEFFSNSSCDQSGFGEGETFLGFGTVTTGSTGNASFSIELPISIPPGRFITATATNQNGDTSEFSQCVQVRALSADLAITKTDSPDPVNVASPLTYTITVRNLGPDTATNVVVTDALPAGVSFASVATTQGSCTGPAVGGTGTVTCSIGNLSPPPSSPQPQQPSPQVTITLVVTPTAGGTITNIATVEGAETDPVPSNNSASQTTTALVANLVMAKTAAPLLPGPGDSLNYTLTVTNSGPSGATNVVVTDQLSANTTFRSVGPPQGWGCTAPQVGATGTVSCSTNTLGAGQSAVITLVVRVGVTVSAGTVITNTARASSSTFDSDETNNMASVTTTVGSPQMRIVPGLTLEMGPVPAQRERSTNPASSNLGIENTGNSPLYLTLSRIERAGPDVDNGKITDRNDESLFSVNEITSRGEFPFKYGTPITIAPSQSASFRVLFNPRNPILAGSFSGIPANLVLPEVITSRLVITRLFAVDQVDSAVQQTGNEVNVNLIGRITPAAKLIHPCNASSDPLVTLVKSGSTFTVECSIFDPNLDLNIVRYQFLDGSDRAVGAPVDVDIGPTISQSQLTKGQGFTIQQKFDDLSQGRPIGKVRVTIYDGAGNDTATSLPVGQTERCGFSTVSAASFTEFGLSNESIVAGFGTGLTSVVQAASTSPLPTELAGIRVSVKDGSGVERLAPLFFVSPGQINYQLPAASSQGAASVTVTGASGLAALGAVHIAGVSPGLFSANSNGRGVAAAVVLRIKADGSQSYEPVSQFNAAQNSYVPVPIDFGPATDQLYLILFGTGVRNRATLSSVNVKIGGIDAPVSYAGEQGGFSGLDQINVALPRELAGRGVVNVVLSVEGRAANVVTIHSGGTNNLSQLPADFFVERRAEEPRSMRSVIVMPMIRLSSPFNGASSLRRK